MALNKNLLAQISGGDTKSVEKTWQEYAKTASAEDCLELVSALQKSQNPSMVSALSGQFYSSVISKAIRENNEKLMHSFLSLMPDKKMRAEKAAPIFKGKEGKKSFVSAAGKNRVGVCQFILDLLPDEEREKMIHADNDEAFTSACEGGAVAAMEFLLDQSDPKKRQAMLHAGNDKSSAKAADSGKAGGIAKFFSNLFKPASKKSKRPAADQKSDGYDELSIIMFILKLISKLVDIILDKLAEVVGKLLDKIFSKENPAAIARKENILLFNFAASRENWEVLDVLLKNTDNVEERKVIIKNLEKLPPFVEDLTKKGLTPLQAFEFRFAIDDAIKQKAADPSFDLSKFPQTDPIISKALEKIAKDFDSFKSLLPKEKSGEEGEIPKQQDRAASYAAYQSKITECLSAAIDDVQKEKQEKKPKINQPSSSVLQPSVTPLNDKSALNSRQN